MPTAIQHGMDADECSFEAIVNGKRESLGQAAMIRVDLGMHAGINEKGIDVRKEAIQEVGTQPRLLVLVEAEALR